MEIRADLGPDLGENALLRMLDPDARAGLAPHLEHVPLALRDSVYESNQPMSHAYFPIAGVISMIAEIDGAAELQIEVATVGNEGMVGLPLFLGAQLTPGRAFCQVPGEAFRIAAQPFLEVVRTTPGLGRLLHRYTQAMLVQISQGTACNRVHPIQERCARWILMTHDRVAGDEFLLTQQFLGQMLGERRASVNIVASMLQQAGFIGYSRGRMRVLDRRGLESASCRCYRVVRDEYDRLLEGSGFPRGVE